MKILIIKLSSLGDLFHALPAVHNLKTELQCRVDWVVNAEYKDLLECCTDVDRVIPFPRGRLLARCGDFLCELREAEYDLILDMQGLLKSALVGRCAKGEKRIGPSFHREGSRLFYDEVAGERNKDRHAVEENLDMVRHLGLKVLPPEFPVKFPKEVRPEKRPRVAILPVSRWRTKNWMPECFAEVGQRSQKERGATIFLLGGVGDIDLCTGIDRMLERGAVNLAGRMTLVEMGSLLQEVDVLVSNDSGPVHMAAAVGTPAVVVFGPTDPKRTGPFGDRHAVVRAGLPCQPCFSRRCPKKDIPCLTAVTPGQVTDEVLRILSL